MVIIDLVQRPAVKRLMWAGLIVEQQIALQPELLSSLVSSSLNQAATWSDCVASIPSVNFMPVMTLVK